MQIAFGQVNRLHLQYSLSKVVYPLKIYIRIYLGSKQGLLS